MHRVLMGLQRGDSRVVDHIDGQFANLNVIPNESAARALLAQRVQLRSQIAEINRQLRGWPCE